MLFDFGTEAVDMQNEVILAVGTEEILNQLTEECGELIQAAQKVRRAMVGTTPISSTRKSCIVAGRGRRCASVHRLSGDCWND